MSIESVMLPNDLFFFFFSHQEWTLLNIIYIKEKVSSLKVRACVPAKLLQLCPTLCYPMDYSLHGILQARILEWVAISFSIPNDLVLSCPLLLPPSIFPSIRVFSNELALHVRWPKYWSFSISPSNEYSGLSSFRIDWFDLLVVQWTLKSLQHYSSKASVHPFFMVKLSHMYMKNHNYCKNHSFDYTDFGQQGDVSAF